MSTRDVVVATIGRAHGLKGEVSLRLRTDIPPEERLHDGAQFEVEIPSGAGTSSTRVLTVLFTRVQQDRWYVRFEEISDRSGAEALRGVDLVMEVDEAEEAEADPDAWYPSQLKGGLAVVHIEDRRELGTVVGVEHYPAQDLLVVRTPRIAAGCSCRWSSSWCRRSTWRPDWWSPLPPQEDSSMSSLRAMTTCRSRADRVRIDVLTLFPDYLAPPLELSLIGKARREGIVDLHVHDLRDYTHDRHRTVDDTPPLGGGAGMVMKPEPWAEAFADVRRRGGEALGAEARPLVVFPQSRRSAVRAGHRACLGGARVDHLRVRAL